MDPSAIGTAIIGQRAIEAERRREDDPDNSRTLVQVPVRAGVVSGLRRTTARALHSMAARVDVAPARPDRRSTRA